MFVKQFWVCSIPISRHVRYFISERMMDSIMLKTASSSFLDSKWLMTMSGCQMKSKYLVALAAFVWGWRCWPGIFINRNLSRRVVVHRYALFDYYLPRWVSLSLSLGFSQQTHLNFLATNNALPVFVKTNYLSVLCSFIKQQQSFFIFLSKIMYVII